MAEIGVRDILINARQESYRMRHFYIGVEHLFIGMLAIQGGLASSILEEQGFTPEYVIDAIRHKTTKGSPHHLWAGMPNTPRADIVLNIANDLALEAGRNEINERDLLTAIFDENESIAIRVLKKLGLNTKELAQKARVHPINVNSQQPYVRIDFGPDFEANMMLAEEHLFILRRMFYGYAQIRIERHLTGGYTQAIVLVVTPIQGDGREDAPVVVKIDQADNIVDEALRYDAHVKHTLPPLTARLEDKPTAPETSEFAGLKYTFVADVDKPPQDLRAAVALDIGTEELGPWLKDMYHYFGKTWWQQRRPYRFQVWSEYDWMLPPILTLELSPGEEASPSAHVLRDPVRRTKLREMEYGDLVVVENFTVQRVYHDRNAIQLAIGRGMEAARRAYKVEVRGVNLKQNTFYRGEVIDHLVGRVWKTRSEMLLHAVRALDPDFDTRSDVVPCPAPIGNLPNPITAHEDLLERYVNGALSKIHGDLHMGNILMGPNRSAFLIDFAQTRDGHTLFDWAMLELNLLSDVVMPTVGGSWKAARSLLPYIATMSEHVPVKQADPEIIRAMAPVRAVREIVYDCLTDKEKWAEYYVPLAMCALRAMTWETLSEGGRRLMFLLSALYCQAISHPLQGSDNTPSADETEETESGD